MILLSILLIALFAAGLWLALAHMGMAADSPWLLAHIASAIAAYALFGAAVVCAWLYAQSERRLRLGSSAASARASYAARPFSMPLLTLERWMFACVYAGFALLTMSLALGAVAGGAGFLFKLQHKTMFAALAWLCFAALVAGRLALGWRGKQAVRMVHFGSAFLLLAYVGTHFVLSVILKR
jgi:ABC-type uncharacterized transport system permease subunit